ncbi:spore coat U domain-containing protein [Agrobacterium sp. BA1120]|uniref:Csu type fimbrial protein n=1 Tax=Agrobacterium sp. BA1120 TaxID=3228927 RepID=UPI00336A0A24
MKFTTTGYGMVVAALIFAPSMAVAQVATTDFNVQITIQAECRINSASALNFGTRGVINGNVDAQSQIIVQCTNNTPFSISLGIGAGNGATVATRLMTSSAAGAPTIAYSLYRDSDRANVWGVTENVDRLTGTGTGATQSFNVYGRVAAQTTPAAGTYNDTVRATINY